MPNIIHEELTDEILLYQLHGATQELEVMVALHETIGRAAIAAKLHSIARYLTKLDHQENGTFQGGGHVFTIKTHK